MSDNAIDPVKYATAKDGVLELILQEADRRVAAQVHLMLAADSRASGILSGCTTLAAAGIGFAISQLVHMSPVSWASLVFGVTEAIAAIMALSALWPTEVRPQGWAPATFRTDLQKSKTVVQAEMAKYLQERIENNRASADKLSNRVKAAMLLASQGPLLGLASSLWITNDRGWALIVSICSGLVFLGLGAALIPGAAKAAKN